MVGGCRVGHVMGWLAAIEAPTIGLADVGLDAAGVVATRSGHKGLACTGLAP